MEKQQQTNLSYEYDKALLEYMLAKQNLSNILQFKKVNSSIDADADPFSSIPLRGGWYGDFIEHPEFSNDRWNELMAAREAIAKEFPLSFPIRYIKYIKENTYPLKKNNNQIEYPNVLIFGLCDSVTCEEDGYNCRICDPYNEETFFISDIYDKEYVLSLIGNVVIANIYIDDEYQAAYSDACGYKANIPIELIVEDICIYGDNLDLSGTIYEKPEGYEETSGFGF